VHDRQTGTTERVSLTRTGAQPRDWSGDPAISGNGRYVAFVSPGARFVAGDTNRVKDVFVRDRLKYTTQRASVSSSGLQGNLDSHARGISGQGRYVVSIRTPPTWSMATPTADHVRPRGRAGWTSSSVTGKRAGPSGSALGRAAVRPTTTATRGRSRRTDASSPSPHQPPTWCQTILTMNGTSSSAPAEPTPMGRRMRFGRLRGGFQNLVAPQSFGT
jgi:hypothetical protein